MWAAHKILKEDDARSEPIQSAGFEQCSFVGLRRRGGLVIWFLLAAWIFFGGAEYMGLLLAMVSGFFLMAIGIPFALCLVWGRHRPGAPHEERNLFAEWASGELRRASATPWGRQSKSSCPPPPPQLV
jgi:hypothetical protein